MHPPCNSTERSVAGCPYLYFRPSRGIHGQVPEQARMTKIWLLMTALTALAGAKPGPIELPRNVRHQVDCAFPKANKAGEYEAAARSHVFWLVVAPDGLNGRTADPDTYGSRFVDRPVVRFFPEGSVLTGMPGASSQADWTGIFDHDGKIWIRVYDGDVQKPGGYCVVRCNAKYLIPVRVSEK